MNEELLNFEVIDRKSFVNFISLLHNDLEQNPTSWTNNTLSSFLEAMTRYAEDIQGYYDNTKQNINADEASWKVFSYILKGSTLYE